MNALIKRSSILCLVTVASSMLLTAPMVLAQQRAAWGAAPGGRAQNTDANLSQLKKPVDHPNLPNFTGHLIFRSGVMRDTPYGTTWREIYGVKEQAQDVTNWYKQVLPMQQWKINADSGQMIAAQHKDGNSCTLNIQPNNNKTSPTHSTLIISYFEPKKQH